MRGFFKRVGESWTILGITLLFFLLLEVFFRIYMAYTPSEDSRVQADCYHQADWVSAYYDEFNACNQSRWEPYVYWRRKPFEGEFINVDAQGLRKTTTKSHPLSKNNPPVKIFFFGGSTMWGSGVRDAYTLPSLIGSELSKAGINPAISNFGETGYVLSQEVTQLVIELKQGNIPDLVVFYDGVNDLFSSYQTGEAGLPQNEYHRELEFNTLTEKKKAFKVFFRSLSTLSTVRFIRQRFGRSNILPEYKHPAPLAMLAEATVQQYNENIRLINALARQYEFEAVFYWQPTLFSKNTLTAYEKAEKEKVLALAGFNREVNDNLFKDELHYESIHFYNLSELLVEYREPLFIDWCHLGEDGHVIVSNTIKDHLMPLLVPADPETQSP